ncbi:MAG: hypothetical protein R3F43_19660 [bacterium]
MMWSAARTLRGRRWLSACLLFVGGLALGGCRDEERPTQPNQPCCGQCGYDEYSVCRRCGYMDICDSPIMEGGPCDLPKLDGYCHCGDDPDCTYCTGSAET